MKTMRAMMRTRKRVAMHVCLLAFAFVLLLSEFDDGTGTGTWSNSNSNSNAGTSRGLGAVARLRRRLVGRVPAKLRPRFYGSFSLEPNSFSLVDPNVAATKIPKTIYMFWETGWETATKMAQLAQGTCRDMNPGYRFVALDGTTADELVDRSSYIPNEVWNKITVQARSDILRAMILYRHGGIWTDASLFCSVPFDQWLHELELKQHRKEQEGEITITSSTKVEGDLLSFRNMLDEGKWGIDPWITSWFLAAPKGAYTLGKIFDVITDPAEFYRFSKEYFWFHRIVSEIANSDERINKRLRTVFPSANPMHCHSDYGLNYRTAPVFKRCNFHEMSKAYEQAVRCCGNSGAREVAGAEASPPSSKEDLSATCADLDCDTFFDLPLIYRAYPGEEDRQGKLPDWEGKIAFKVVEKKG